MVQYIVYIIAAVLIIGWALGYLVFHLGDLIHVALVVGIVMILLKLIGGPPKVKTHKIK
jgi:Family of unknown function (DUF5670)